MSTAADPPLLPEAVKASCEAVFKAFREHHSIPGLAFGVIVDGQLGHVGTSGLAHLEHGTAVSEDTVFRIASMTKSITAACILMLRDKGLLRLDDPLSRFLPEARHLAPPTTDSPTLSLRHLLTMSAGLVEDDPWADRQVDMEDLAFGELLASGVPFNRAPGTGYEYSNLGYALLGRVVAAVSGESLSTFASTRLLHPLGMRSTVWDVGEVADQARARGYRRSDAGWQEEVPLGPGAFGAMGGLWTTIADFSRYVAFHLSAWPPRDSPDVGPLRRSSAREMQHGQSPVTSPRPLRQGLTGLGYGYGLLSAQHQQHGRVVSHSGGLPGFGSHVEWLPDCAVGVVAFANLTYAPVREAVGEAITALDAAGCLVPRRFPPAPALLAAREAAIRLYEFGDCSLVASMAADNLFLDRSAEQRQREARALRTERGRCLDQAALVAEGALRGSWRMKCERGEIAARVWLSPTAPPRVQMLSLEALPPADETGREFGVPAPAPGGAP